MHITMRNAVCLLLCLLLSLTALAQDDDTDIDITELQADAPAGTQISGTIDDSMPRQVYSFSGTRGEVIRLTLTTVSGDLDPVLTVFDHTGAVLLRQDDMAGSRDVSATITINSNTVHYVVVARFGAATGSTRGDFELNLSRIGILGQQGSTLRYGVPVMNRITAVQPQVYYTFQANAGDILNVEMIRSSGTLDPYVQVVDSNRFVVAENDDTPESNSHNALIEGLVIESPGTYIVVATRYGLAAGDSVGSFVLTVYESEFSGLSNSRLAPATLQADTPVEGELDDTRYEQFYSFQAERDDLVTLTMELISGRLDTALVLANAGLQPLVEDDDGGAGTNARIGQYRIPATGTYYVIATRSGGLEGTTSGSYRLTLRREGNAFAEAAPEVVRLSYGATQQGIITQQDADNLYVFYGYQGDRVRINMNRADGDLDPLVELLDWDQLRMVYDDDGGSGQNAQVEYPLPRTGLYYIRATRYTGTAESAQSTGRYNLVITRVSGGQ